MPWWRFDGEFITLYATNFRLLKGFGSKVDLPIQIPFSRTHKFRCKLPVTVALRKKSGRKTWNIQKPKGGTEYNKATNTIRMLPDQMPYISFSKVPKRDCPEETYPLVAETRHFKRRRNHFSMSPQKKFQKEDFIRDEIVNK